MRSILSNAAFIWGDTVNGSYFGEWRLNEVAKFSNTYFVKYAALFPCILHISIKYGVIFAVNEEPFY